MNPVNMRGGGKAAIRVNAMNERVLIVDDEASVHDVVRAYPEREGFIVYSATRVPRGWRSH